MYKRVRSYHMQSSQDDGYFLKIQVNNKHYNVSYLTFHPKIILLKESLSITCLAMQSVTELWLSESPPTEVLLNQLIPNITT